MVRSENVIVLDVRDLTAFSAATPGQLMSRAEAVAVMMWRFHRAPETAGRWQHRPPPSPSSAPSESAEVAVLWDEPTQETVESHRNELKNVERAAEAVAIALADHLGFRVLGEAHHGSGCDWLMVRKGEPTTDFYMLEVSGIIRKSSDKPSGRLREKLLQGREGDLMRPGMAVVVRFEDMRILSEMWQ
jgi:hypothetical protein